MIQEMSRVEAALLEVQRVFREKLWLYSSRNYENLI